MNDNKAASEEDKGYPCTCDIELTLPTVKQAKIVKRVLEVDTEVGNRVRKVLQLQQDAGADCVDGGGKGDPRVLKVYVRLCVEKTEEVWSCADLMCIFSSRCCCQAMDHSL